MRKRTYVKVNCFKDIEAYRKRDGSLYSMIRGRVLK